MCVYTGFCYMCNRISLRVRVSIVYGPLLRVWVSIVYGPLLRVWVYIVYGPFCVCGSLLCMDPFCVCGSLLSYLGIASFLCLWCVYRPLLRVRTSPCVCTQVSAMCVITSYCLYGLATINRLLKIIGLFCKRDHTRDPRTLFCVYVRLCVCTEVFSV